VTTKSAGNVSETESKDMTPSPSADANRKWWAELFGDPEPVTDPRGLEVLRNNLAYTAILVADVLLEHARHCCELRDRGEAYKPDKRIADEYWDALWSLDRCWRNHVRLTQRDASRIVSSAIEAYAGPDIATLVEAGLDRYRRLVLPGYAMSQDVHREVAAERAQKAAESR
jgi:hypothetical protein